MIPEAKRGEAAVKAVQAAIDVAEQAKSLGPVTELEQKIAANPADHQTRFDLAVALAASGDRLNAANHSKPAPSTAKGTSEPMFNQVQPCVVISAPEKNEVSAIVA